VLPDAGLLGPRLLASPGARVVAVDVARLALPAASSTFHGRDLFAPIAARLASGETGLDELGSSATPRASSLSPCARVGAGLEGVVVVVDRFGNLISNLEIEADGRARAAGARVAIGNRWVALRRTYADVEPAELVAVVNAWGVVEVAVRNGSASATLGLGVDAPVRLEPAPEPA